MSLRNVPAMIAAGLLLASPFAASAATTQKTTTTKTTVSASTACKGLHGDKLVACKKSITVKKK